MRYFIEAAYFTKTDGTNGTSIYKYKDINNKSTLVKPKNQLPIPNSNDITYFQGKLYLCSGNNIYQVKEKDGTYSVINTYSFADNKTFGINSNTKIDTIAFYKGKISKDKAGNGYYLANMILGIKRANNTSGFTSLQGTTYLEDSGYLYTTLSDNSKSNNKNAVLVTKLTGLDTAKAQTKTIENAKASGNTAQIIIQFISFRRKIVNLMKLLKHIICQKVRRPNLLLI